MNRAEMIDTICEAVRKPCPEVVKSIHPKIGFVYRSQSGGTVCHKPGGFATVADAVADHNEREAAGLAELRVELAKLADDILQLQYNYWTKQAAKAARLGR